MSTRARGEHASGSLRGAPGLWQPTPTETQCARREVSCVVVSTGEDVRRLEAFLGAPRDQPVVLLTRVPGGEEPVLAPERVRRIVGPGVRIYFVVSERALMRLRRLLGERLAVTEGAVRVWWPGFTRHSDPEDHPLMELIAEPGDELEEFARRFDLSRPRVRRELKLTEEALAHAEYELRQAAQRAAQAEAAMEAMIDQTMPADLDERLHALIAGEWRRTLTADERRSHPLRYVLRPEFAAALRATAAHSTRASGLGVRDARLRVSGCAQRGRAASGSKRPGRASARARGRRHRDVARLGGRAASALLDAHGRRGGVRGRGARRRV